MRTPEPEGDGPIVEPVPERTGLIVEAPPAPGEQRGLVHPGPDHVVQFYEDDGFLCDAVAHFVAAGLAAGEPVCVVATPHHRGELALRLTRKGIAHDEVRARGQLVWLDAEETLAQFLVEDRPDWTLFQAYFTGVFERCRRTPLTRVRTYGEMVDVLWRRGNRQAALELEAMWNELASRHAISLMCAYIMGNFYRSGDVEAFRSVCRAHSSVLHTEPPERSATAEIQQREIDELQQRAVLLELEIQHRKELEVALREALMREKEARAEAERSARFNEMFAGMLGHDLRNPLSAISTGALYISRLNASPKSSKAATRIISSAERMARMIDQLLDFTRIRVGGGLPLAPTRVDLHELCCKVRDELEAATPERSIVVEVNGDTSGDWDRDRLLQVLSNLVGNAVHHGDPAVPVTIRCDGLAPRTVALSVHNGGVVPPQLAPLLFEPFRGTNRSQRTRGLGLGLFITHQIVEAHGGSIGLASDQATGTTFRLELPRSAVARPAPIKPTLPVAPDLP